MANETTPGSTTVFTMTGITENVTTVTNDTWSSTTPKYSPKTNDTGVIVGCVATFVLFLLVLCFIVYRCRSESNGTQAMQRAEPPKRSITIIREARDKLIAQTNRLSQAMGFSGPQILEESEANSTTIAVSAPTKGRSHPSSPPSDSAPTIDISIMQKRRDDFSSPTSDRGTTVAISSSDTPSHPVPRDRPPKPCQPQSNPPSSGYVNEEFLDNAINPPADPGPGTHLYENTLDGTVSPPINLAISSPNYVNMPFHTPTTNVVEIPQYPHCHGTSSPMYVNEDKKAIEDSYRYVTERGIVPNTGVDYVNTQTPKPEDMYENSHVAAEGKKSNGYVQSC